MAPINWWHHSLCRKLMLQLHPDIFCHLLYLFWQPSVQLLGKSPQCLLRIHHILNETKGAKVSVLAYSVAFKHTFQTHWRPMV